MKKKFALLLCTALILALFSACNSGTPAPAPTATTAPTSAATAAPTATATATEAATEVPLDDTSGGYNYAAGNYEVDADGLALAPYEYQLPLTSNSDVLVYWNVCYTPQYIPPEGFGSMPYQVELERKTGVIIEYLAPSAEAKQENFAVLLAADTLPDMMAHGLTYYGKSARNAIDEDFFVNLYDYKEYMPNYLYQVKAFDDIDTRATVYYDDSTIVWFYGLLTDPTPSQGYAAREDWIERVGLNADDITTFDEVYEMLTLFKTELDVQWPMEVFYTIELVPGYMFSGYNTAFVVSPYGLPWTKVIDGQIQFSLSTEDDRDLMTMLSKWYSEGLIDPGWPGYTSNDQMSPMITTGQTGYVSMNPSQVEDFERATDDPEVRWTALSRPLRYEGQILKYGQKLSRTTYGVVTISTRCPNIELAVTWNDYFYSPEGSDFSSWGVEGVTWEYDANGEKTLTDWVVFNPDAIPQSWLLNMYAGNNLCDATLFTQARSYAYPGGDRLFAMFQKWMPEQYDGDYDTPSNLRQNLTDDQLEEVSTYTGDLVTFISESCHSFFDGSRPMSEWDQYVQGLENMGMSRIREIYQDAYDKVIASFS